MFNAALFKQQTIGVLGLGKSGLAVAKLLASKGFSVLISESATVPPEKMPALPAGISVETGGHTERLFACGCWIKSPGISPRHEVLVQARQRGIRVYSELEAALSFLPPQVRIFAVTGTNGKTTTTALLGKILSQAARGTSRRVHVCGNIGSPVSLAVGQVQSGDDMVIEVSSYQLEDSTYFHPKYACVLNITPDHLEHHGGMENYIRAKAAIFRYQTADDLLVLNGADPLCAQLAAEAPSRVAAFSTQPKHLLKTDVFFDGDEMIFSEGDALRPPHLSGLHNVENAMAAALMALAAGVPAATVQQSFDTFSALEHRIEPFAVYNGVTYINDSKATNLDSTITALKSFEGEKNIWLILGGRDKGASYEVLLPYLQKTCKHVLTIGEAMDKIERELNGYPVVRCDTLARAVEVAMQGAVSGDKVLLSPACASFDQFTSFEDRGRQFKQLVCARIPV